MQKKNMSLRNHCANKGYGWGDECSRNISIDDQARISVENEKEMIRFGEYDVEIELLRKYFPKNEVVVVANRYFFENQGVVMNKISSVIGGPKMKIPWNIKSNVSKKKTRMENETKIFLQEYYEKHIRAFSRLIASDKNMILIPDDMNEFMRSLLPTG